MVAGTKQLDESTTMGILALKSGQIDSWGSAQGLSMGQRSTSGVLAVQRDSHGGPIKAHRD